MLTLYHLIEGIGSAYCHSHDSNGYMRSFRCDRTDSQLSECDGVPDNNCDIDCPGGEESQATVYCYSGIRKQQKLNA